MQVLESSLMTRVSELNRAIPSVVMMLSLSAHRYTMESERWSFG